jgi:DNA (cytosine-5)-methyltransferase 1
MVDYGAERLTFIDLFAGCGGLSLGFTWAGFTPIQSVEWDKHAAATHSVNIGGEIFAGDIADWLEGVPPNADVILGGPPCQGFSQLGAQNPDDPRNSLWDQYVDALVAVEPTYFVLENVPAFLKSKQFDALVSEMTPGERLEGYEIEHYVLDASHYGVPQSRRRAIIIGRPAGTPELGRPAIIEGRRTVADAIGAIETPITGTQLPQSQVVIHGETVPGVFKMADLHITREPSDVSLRRYAAIPPGGNRFDLPDELLTPCWRRHTSGSGDVMGRLLWDSPSVTIRTEFFKPEKGRYLHPELNRPLTHLEAALLQTFPEDFQWCGTKTSIARQIGNAVPPVLAHAIAEHLKAALQAGP